MVYRDAQSCLGWNCYEGVTSAMPSPEARSRVKPETLLLVTALAILLLVSHRHLTGLSYFVILESYEKTCIDKDEHTKNIE